MKKTVKIIALMLAAVMLAALVPAVSASEGSLVALGDSIAAGTGVYNANKACYARIVADSIGYSYANFAKNGDRSQDLLAKLFRDDVASAVADADIILMSIGGNDYLQQNLPVLLSDYNNGDYHHLDNIEANLKNNFADIIARIKSLNPDVLLVVQTLYNPRTDALKDFYGEGVKRVNRVITGYLADNPGAFELVDIESVIGNNAAYIAVDTIHPNAVGHRLIAQAIVEYLNSIGFTSSSGAQQNTIGIDEIPFISYIIQFFRMVADFIARMFG